MSNTKRPSRHEDVRKAKAPSTSLRAFFSFPRSRTAEANEIKAELRKLTIEVLPFNVSQEGQSGLNNSIGKIHDEIRNCNSFVHFLTKETAGNYWLHYELRAAILHYKTTMEKNVNLIFAVFDDTGPPPELALELSDFSPVDFRDPSLRAPSIVNLAEKIRDNLRHSSKADRQKEYKDYVYSDIMSPNPRMTTMRRIFRDEFHEAFKEHVGDKLKDLTDLRRAQDKLMTPEIIQIAEAQAFDDIWVVSHNLNTDLHNKEMGASIEKNLHEKGIEYTYFVPNTTLVRRAIEKYHEQYGKLESGKASPVAVEQLLQGDRVEVGRGAYKFRFLEAGVFMPFDELVIYDGENTGSRWGYLSMSYESTGDAPLTMKVPERTLNLVVNFLSRHMNGRVKRKFNT
jgi:hypothetical protein